jgi:para-nitrobenzyl esterase
MRYRWTSLILVSLASCGGGDGGGVSGNPPPPLGCVSTATVVCTQSGQLQGAVEGAFRAFRGIPFAAPPVGDLRWRPPAPPASWQGVRSATAFGNRCPQVDTNGQPLGNEDCLTLNIYAINPPASTKQPVMVFIHGGGESRGSAQNAPWDLVPPLAGQGVIVVTVQYRLGLLGWLVHPSLTAEAQGSSGNYGLMDLVAALKWVHDDITEFGGDPATVMIFGESAGSLNVQALLASPAAAGLFSAAAMESRVLRGGLIGSGVADAYPWYAGLESLVNCDAAADVLACLRAVPADTLVQTSLNSAATGWVNIEPNILPEDLFNKLQRLGSAVPLLIGSNSDEEAFSYVPGPVLDPSSYAASIHTQFDPLAAGAGDTILSLYPAMDYTNPNYALSAVESDAHYTCDTRNLARAVSDGRRPRVWRYLFTHHYENDAGLNAMGAFHSAELPFVSGNLQTLTTGIPYSPSVAETTLANEMMGYWVRFAATGDPNGPGAAQWLPYDTGENILQLDDSIVTLAGGYRNAQCDFLSTLPIRF